MTDDPTRDADAAPEPPARDEPRRTRGTSPVLFLVLGALAGTLGLGVYSGISARSAADATLKRATEEAAVAVVNECTAVSKAAVNRVSGLGNDDPIALTASPTLWQFACIAG